jgi:hypothetical protein
MTEKEWLKCRDPDTLLVFRRRKSYSRKLRLFGSASVRRVWDLLPDKLFRDAVEVVERHADKDITDKRLETQKNRCKQLCGTPHWNRRADPATSTAALAATECLAPESFAAAVGGAWYAALAEARTASAKGRLWEKVRAEQATLLGDIFGNPFRKPKFNKKWRTDTALSLSRQMYESRDFGAMPILADALQDAGCDNEDILAHCRDVKQTHVRGCWVVDLVLGKE